MSIYYKTLHIIKDIEQRWINVYVKFQLNSTQTFDEEHSGCQLAAACIRAGAHTGTAQSHMSLQWTNRNSVGCDPAAPRSHQIPPDHWTPSDLM